MPGFDRTGPLGYGSMSGRGMGPCGRGYARGFGRGFRRFAPVPAQVIPYAQPQYEYRKEDEIADIKAEKELIERDLKVMEERIGELEKDKS